MISAETLFDICNFSVLPAWLLLAFAPTWSLTQRLVQQVWIPLLLGAVYLGLLLFAPPPPEGGDFFSLAGVMTFFTSPYAVVMGWVHYLVFDLFVGAWEVRDAQRHEISHWLVVPCLFFTLMFGPVGLLAYLTLRLATSRIVTL